VIDLPFVTAVGLCPSWVPWTAYAKVQHLHGWKVKRTVRERLLAETFLAEALALEPTLLQTWGARPRPRGLPWGLTVAGAAAWRLAKVQGLMQAPATREVRAARVRVAIDRITELRRIRMPWCRVAWCLTHPSAAGLTFSPGEGRM
jgi:hypothetical protein